MERHRSSRKFTKEGNKIYIELKKEFLDKYMPKADADPTSDVTMTNDDKGGYSDEMV